MHVLIALGENFNHRSALQQTDVELQREWLLMLDSDIRHGFNDARDPVRRTDCSKRQCDHGD